MTVLKSFSNLVFYFRLVCKFIFGFLCPQHLKMYSMSSLRQSHKSLIVYLGSAPPKLCWSIWGAPRSFWNCAHHIAYTFIMLNGFSCVWLCATLWITVSWLHCPWDFPGKNTRVGCHLLLQEIFPTQGLNPGLLYPPVLADRFFTSRAIHRPSQYSTQIQ